MKLSDVMSAAGLAGYAEIGLCIFLLVFLSVTVRTFRGGMRQEFERMGALPLLGEEAPSARNILDRAEAGTSHHEH